MSALRWRLSSCLWLGFFFSFLVDLTLAEDSSCKANNMLWATDVPFHLDEDKLVKEKVSDIPTLKEIFSRQYQSNGNEIFAKQVTETYKNEDLNPKTTVNEWVPRRWDVEGPSDTGLAIGKIFSIISEVGLWILIAILVLLVIRYQHVWLPWVTRKAKPEHPQEVVEEYEIAAPESIPDDLPAAVRTLSQKGQHRAALALFYRGSVKRLTESLNTLLPPGSTEAECLRLARRSPDTSYAKLFARIVLIWQEMAYAQRLPKPEVLEVLLREWERRNSVS